MSRTFRFFSKNPLSPVTAEYPAALAGPTRIDVFGVCIERDY
jgi:hypothetical protein